MKLYRTVFLFAACADFSSCCVVTCVTQRVFMRAFASCSHGAPSSTTLPCFLLRLLYLDNVHSDLASMNASRQRLVYDVKEKLYVLVVLLVLLVYGLLM